MPKKKDNLHELIKKMTPSEKRYFKLFVKGNSRSSENKYIQLFDAISRQSTYNESFLLKKFDYGKNPNGLAVAKNYLFQLILKCLRNYGYNKSIDAEVIGLIQDAQSLYHRRQFEVAQRNILKARKIAESVKREDLILMVCRWERLLVEQVAEASEYVDRYKDIMQREQNASHILEINTALFTQYKKLKFRNLREGYKQADTINSFFSQVLGDPLLAKDQPPDNPTSLLYYWMCYFEYHCGIRGNDRAYQISQEITTLFQLHPELKNFDPESYLICTYNNLLFLLENGKINTFQEEVIHFHDLDIPANNHFLQRRKSIDYFNLMLIYYEMIGEFETAIDVVAPQIKDYFKTHKHGLIDHEEFFLKNTAAWLYLVVGEPEEAAIWLSYLDAEINRNHFIDYFMVCRVLLMAVHHTLKNYQVVESMAKSTLRILEAKDKFSAADAFIIKFFRKAGAAGDVREKQVKLLEQFIEEMTTIYQYMNYSPPYCLYGVIKWAESRLHRQPLAQVLRENSKRLQTNAINAGQSSALHNNPSFVIRRGSSVHTERR